jgi:hypothetical protein
MLPEVMEDDDFLQVSISLLVNISETVRAIYLTFSQVKDMSLHVLQQRHHYHGGRNRSSINISGTKQAINLKSLQGKTYGS